MMSDDAKAHEAASVFKKIEQLELFARSNNIMLFSSLKDELPTHDVIKKWAATKNIYLPRVNGENLEVVKFEPNDMAVGSYNILEPTSSDLFPPEKLDLIIVPGVAFDPAGNRLGRGKGFYDRFLTQCTAPTIAVCFDCQLVEDLPTQPHDVKIMNVVTCSFSTLSKN